jgi:hypothetical protein
MSGIIHFVNQTPVTSFCKKQKTVETSTYGSELMVARQAAQQIIDLRYTLRMMGIPLDGPSWMFGDNESAITFSTRPHLLLTNVTMPYLTIVSVNALQQTFFTYSMFWVKYILLKCLQNPLVGSVSGHLFNHCSSGKGIPSKIHPFLCLSRVLNLINRSDQGE